MRFIAGFRPGRRGLLRQGSGQAFCFGKRTQNHIDRDGPFGSPARFADSGVAETCGVYPESCRSAQTMRAFLPVSAALLGHTTRPGEATERRRFFFEWSNSLLNVVTIQTLEEPQDPDSIRMKILRMTTDEFCGCCLN